VARRLIFVAICGALACIAAIAAIVMGLPQSREIDYSVSISIYHDRRADLAAIWLSLCRFRESHGRFPRNIVEWYHFDPAASRLTARPANALGPYLVDFDRLDNEGVSLIVRDPGVFVQDFGAHGDAVVNGVYSDGRMGLVSNGLVFYYGPAHERSGGE
jgi:hypothetical protein